MKKRTGMILGAFLALALAGCGGSTLRGPDALPDPTIKFVNAASDSAGLDYYLNDELKAPGVTYLQGTAGFLSVPFKDDVDGAYDISSRAPGTLEDVDRISTVLARDKHYIAVTLGLLFPADGDDEKRARLALTEINRTPPTGDKAHLYVLHAFSRSPGNETPQVTFQTPGDNPQFKLENLDFGGSKDIVVDSGFQTFEVRRADVDGENVYATAGINLVSGGIYFVIFSGVEDSGTNPPTLQFLTIEPKP